MLRMSILTAMSVVPLTSLSAEPPAYALAARERLWNSEHVDENSIHAVGNGQIVALSAGPNVDCLFGPPYTSPNVMQLATRVDGTATGYARREVGAAIWHHRHSVENRETVRFTEFAPARLSAYVRLFDCRASGVAWVIKPHADGGFALSTSVPGTFIQRLKPGTLIFRDPYVTDQWSNHWVVPQGECDAEINASGDLVVTLKPGKGSLSIVGATDYRAGVAAVEELLDAGAACFLEPTRAHWQAFTKRRLAARPALSGLPDDAAEDLDGIAVMMKAQQAAQGPAIIGWHSPMAYIRDLYGASRGMLALGMFEEARQCLLFRLRKFERFGDVRTAELIGTDCARHTYNDDVEGPGYLILQARDYLEATGDTATVRRLWPMLSWCWTVQQRQLAGGLLPFNGDETYVAGGLFPMTGLEQGSADTTLALIVSGTWLIDWAQHEGFWTTEHAAAQRRILSASRAAWRKWFPQSDRVWANAPERTDWVEPPRFRLMGSTVLERAPESGHYVRPEDLGRDLPPAVPPERMTLNSVSLLPGFLGGHLLDREVSRNVVERILSFARPNGVIPSCNEEDCTRAVLDREVVAWDGGISRIGDRVVGYDPGLILMALTALDHPAAQDAYTRMMGMLDQAGAWNEYYDANDEPVRACIRANMWASGINAEAAVNYLLHAED